MTTKIRMMLMLTLLCCLHSLRSHHIFADAYVNRTSVEETIVDIRRMQTLSAACAAQIVQFLVDLSDHKSWPFRVIDSFGKPEAGAFNGELRLHTFLANKHTNAFVLNEATKTSR